MSAEQLPTPVTPYQRNVLMSITMSTPPPAFWNQNRLSNSFSPFPSALSIPATPSPAPLLGSGKKRKGKENNLSRPTKKQKTLGTTPEPLTTGQKLRLFYGFLKHELGWTYGEALFHTSITFSGDPEIATPIPNSGHVLPCQEASRESIVASMRHFFNGDGNYTPAAILKNWYKHPYGRLERDSDLMFSLSPVYTEILPVRAMLTSFAAQTVAEKLVHEAEDAVHSESGLHVSLYGQRGRTKALEWTDIGMATLNNTGNIIRQKQPLTYELVRKLCSRPPRVRNGVIAVRQKRPTDLVATGVISTINFSRSSRARLLPLATSILYFGSSASTDLFRYRSRLGEMPSYGATLKAMRALSEHEAAVTLEHGSRADTLGVIRLDNVQNYLIQRDPGIGRENKLNIGLAATYYEVDDEEIDIAVFDLEKKQQLLAEGKRRDLTVRKLHDMIDHAHIEQVCIIQWINTLVQHIPHLAHLKPDVARVQHTRVAKIRLKAKPAKVHPLASSSRSETILTDFKEALHDFFAQIGQTPESFKHRTIPVGGDGLTYQKTLELQEYLQFHSNDFESMKNVKPLLEWWHTEWTNLSRIFESHWGDLHTQDPSSLGHSAAKIGRKKPPNLKKVDFYTSSDLAFLVLDVRMLDCWRLLYNQEDLFQYFANLATCDQLPSFENLEKDAQKLYRSYTSMRAQERALRGPRLMESSPAVPVGSTWDMENPLTKVLGKPFTGDQILARSISFIRDTMLAREFSIATADGDVGRLWEVIKVMVFTFAGSSHSNYTHYLLEMITDLELESSSELRHAVLRLTLVNLTGQEGHWSAGDFVQEYFNRLLEAIVQRKGVEYGDTFIRQTWARNLHHVGRLKLSWMEGAGLKRRSTKHQGAKKDAEIRILMDLYRETELHSFRSGRSLDNEPYIDDFQKGTEKLEGKLPKWLKKTINSRGLQGKGVECTLPTVNATEDGGNSDSDGEDHEEEPQPFEGRPLLRFTAIVDGELVIDGIGSKDMEDMVDEVIEVGDDSDLESSDEEEN